MHTVLWKQAVCISDKDDMVFFSLRYFFLPVKLLILLGKDCFFNSTYSIRTQQAVDIMNYNINGQCRYKSVNAARENLMIKNKRYI